MKQLLALEYTGDKICNYAPCEMKMIAHNSRLVPFTAVKLLN